MINQLKRIGMGTAMVLIDGSAGRYARYVDGKPDFGVVMTSDDLLTGVEVELLRADPVEFALRHG
jgi:hypothetical protein